MVAIQFSRCAFKMVALAVVFSMQASAADLSVRLETDDGRPLEHAAVALLAVASGSKTLDPDEEPVEREQPEAILDQRDRQFAPYVLTVATDTLVRFPNSDNIRHHVYSFSPAKRFELRLYHGSTAEPVRFDQPGTVALGCNIHDAMLAYIYVVDSDWHGVSDAEGQLQLTGLPEGEYSLQVQHPRLAQPLNQPLIVGSEANVVELLTVSGLGPDPRGERERSDLQRLFDR